MRIALSLVALAFATVPTIAFAANDIGCVETRLGADAIARIGDAVVVAADKGTPLDSSLDRDRDAVIAARNACRSTNKWSNDATDLAMSYMKATATRVGIERALTAEGVRPDGIVAGYLALNSTQRRGIVFDKGLAGAAQFSILQHVTDLGLSDSNKRNRVTRHVTILYSALSAIEFYPAEFAGA